MDFRLDETQQALRDSVRALARDHFDLSAVAGREHAPIASATWRALADLGVFTMMRPADRGGLGGGAVEASVIYEQLGAHLATGPRRWSTAAAPVLTDDPDTTRVTGVDLLTSRRDVHVVEHARESDVLVVVHHDHIERCDPSALGPPVADQPLDPLTPAAAYAVLPRGDVVGDADDARRIRLAGTILAAAELVGVAQGALDVASTYARERHQFGVPIGSFQAVKHLLADMYVRVELARAATYAAAAIFDSQSADAPGGASPTVAPGLRSRRGSEEASGGGDASAAKLLAGEAGIANGRGAVQILGGMGFTWEMLPHYFLKRAWVLEQSFGAGDLHALTLSTALAAEVRPAAMWT